MATASDFAVDANIQSLANRQRRGTVIGNKLKNDQEVAVEWDDGTVQKVNVNDIQVCLSMEEEFKLVQDQVNDKLGQAATLIREAADLARNNGQELLDEYGQPYSSKFEVRQLQTAMDHAGWNTSSWYC